MATSKFLNPWDQRSIPWVFYKPNVDEPMLFEIEQVFRYIMCHSILWVPMCWGQKLKVGRD